MASRVAKSALFDAFASVAQAFGSGRRAEIVDVLTQGERSVEELAKEIEQSVANTSHHLQQLARAGLLRSRREGTRIHYRLASERVADLWAAVREVAEQHLAEVHVLAQDYLGDRSEIEQLLPEELEERLGRGRSSSSTCGRSANTTPGTSRARCPRRFRNSRSSPRRCRGERRSSPTVAAPTACTPTTRFASCVNVA